MYPVALRSTNGFWMTAKSRDSHDMADVPTYIALASNSTGKEIGTFEISSSISPPSYRAWMEGLEGVKVK